MNLKLCLIILLCSAKILAQQSIIVHGALTGAPTNAKIYLSRFTDDGRWQNDNLTLDNGKFDVTFESSHPVQLKVYNSKSQSVNDKEMAIVYADPGEQFLTGDYTDLSTVKVRGLKTQREADALKLELQKFKVKKDELLQLYKPDLEGFTTATDDKTRQDLAQRVDDYCRAFDKVETEELITELNFFKAHPDSFVAIWTLYARMGQSNLVSSRDQIAAISRGLSAPLKNSKPGVLLMERVQRYENSRTGAVAPDFKMTDIDGNAIALSDFRKKKYVLIDFWASYCAACRAEYPELKPVFKEYPNLLIICLSQDKNLDAWKKAIIEDETKDWTHISLLQNNANSVSENYNVSTIPVKLLINPAGKIIARWEGSGQTAKFKSEFHKFFHEQ